MSDEEIWKLNRGGHDPHKIYAAYHAAVNHKGQPTVILAKTVKGYGMGEAGEGQNITHQQKKMGDEAVRSFRDRFQIPIGDAELAEAPYYKPPEDSAEMRYLKERRKVLGGYLPQRRHDAPALEIPELKAFDALLKDTGEREISTTMAFVRILNVLCRDKAIGKFVVPIVPDESRTFGMEGMFRQLGIYSAKGQLYKPEDADQLMYYKEDKSGQVLQEGITEAGGMSSWIAAASAYSAHGVPMIPFFIFYSMFGFQRVGDLCWAAGDIRARGFLIGGTAGRTTLNGEGLQHEDGHSHVLAATVPNCISYDPTFAYEMAVIIHHGLERMFVRGDDVYFYITAMNENYRHPAMPEGAEDGIVKGLYRLQSTGKAREKKKRVQLLGSGTILHEVIEGAALLEQDFGVSADIWSATSFNQLARDGHEVARWNLLHPTETPRKAYVTECLEGQAGPVIAATDYIRLYADQIRAFVPQRYVVLGTDGFGRSDTRERLRRHFEVDRHHVARGGAEGAGRRGRDQARRGRGRDQEIRDRSGQALSALPLIGDGDGDRRSSGRDAAGGRGADGRRHGPGAAPPRPDRGAAGPMVGQCAAAVAGDRARGPSRLHPGRRPDHHHQHLLDQAAAARRCRHRRPVRGAQPAGGRARLPGPRRAGRGRADRGLAAAALRQLPAGPGAAVRGDRAALSRAGGDPRPLRRPVLMRDHVERGRGARGRLRCGFDRQAGLGRLDAR